MLGTKAAWEVIGRLVLLKARFLQLYGAVGPGPHGVGVSVLPSYLRVVEGAEEGAHGLGVLGNLRCVSVHCADGRRVLVIELTIRQSSDGDIFWKRQL